MYILYIFLVMVIKDDLLPLVSLNSWYLHLPCVIRGRKSDFYVSCIVKTLGNVCTYIDKK